jgi:ribonuclease T2
MLINDVRLRRIGVRVATFAGLILTALASSSAGSQSYQCVPPANLPRPTIEMPKPNEARRVPVDGYLLTLSWSPEYCRDHKTDMQCTGKMGDFGFVLHGLWPRKVIAANICMTPSVQLIQHEWAKHGTCMTRTPEAYFGAAKLLYDAVVMPDMDKLSRAPLNAGGVAQAFAAINPGLPAKAIAVTMNPRGWLDEVRICLGNDLKPTVCEASKRGAPDKTAVKVWRGG